MPDSTPQQRPEHDRQPPPGGPLRQDAPAPGAAEGTDEPPRHPGGDPDHERSTDDDGVATETQDRDLQQENAETSLDQPSQ